MNGSRSRQILKIFIFAPRDLRTGRTTVVRQRFFPADSGLHCVLRMAGGLLAHAIEQIESELGGKWRCNIIKRGNFRLVTARMKKSSSQSIIVLFDKDGTGYIHDKSEKRFSTTFGSRLLMEISQ